ncbi:LTA synthase family protein [Marinobacterium sp. YM272]|uniref:LTA synthase family protein n=1 Tax=Marinobacterium sp. YM272 TaxID=3421654 RepID=UPI003D7F30AC
MLLIVSAGLLVSVLMAALVSPTGGRPRLPNSYAWLSGLAWWLAWFAAVCLISQRPYFAATLVVVLHAVLIAVNYSKFTALREPFILQDFEYFSDAIRHPRLYIPFFGIVKTLVLIIAAAIAIGLFLWLEKPLSSSGMSAWQLPAGALFVSLIASAGAWLIRPRLTLDPLRDMQTTGLISLLHSHLAEYWLARRKVFADPVAEWPSLESNGAMPHLVMVQSESFFDPRPSYPFVEPSVLANWDECSAVAAAAGRLSVPAWGANTVRTEAAVLTGLSRDALGIFQYNPYRRLAKKPVSSLASHLRAQGYKTVCVHPYLGHFYQRDRVLASLGFDEFIDISAFDESDRCGQYTGDLAVSDKVKALLASTREPLFVFVITMENHGPLHLEQPEPGLASRVYTEIPSGPVDDLTVYLGHLQHADAMVSRLTEALQSTERGGSLCWYGDHVPIMPEVYSHFGEPEATTPWLVWTSANMPQTGASSGVEGPSCAAEQLAKCWLQIVKECRWV